MSEVISRKASVWVWFALLVLLFATWAFSRLDLSPFNPVIAIGISLAKMILILLYFMHLRHSERLIWVVAAAGFIWLFIMIELTMTDYLTRGASWPQ